MRISLAHIDLQWGCSVKKNIKCKQSTQKKKYVRCGHIEPNHRKTKNYGKPFKNTCSLVFRRANSKSISWLFSFNVSCRRGGLCRCSSAAELALDAMAELCLGPVGTGSLFIGEVVLGCALVFLCMYLFSYRCVFVMSLLLCLYICLCICLSVCLCIFLKSICLSIHQSVFVCPLVFSVHLSIPMFPLVYQHEMNEIINFSHFPHHNRTRWTDP